MVTFLIYLIIAGCLLYVVDKFLLVPYAAPIVRTIFWIVVSIALIIITTNFFGLTHIRLPK